MTIRQSASTNTAHDWKPLDRMDAIGLLQADHEAIAQLFAEHATAHSPSNKEALIAEICKALLVHGQIEEELFFPAVKGALNDEQLVPEAAVERTGVKCLIAQLQAVQPEGDMFNATVQVLSEYVKHPLEEAHEALFVQTRASSLNLVELGTRMAARKAVLLAQAC